MKSYQELEHTYVLRVPKMHLPYSEKWIHRVTIDRPKPYLFQSYFSKAKIPSDVYVNIAFYAPSYEHIVLDDQDLLEFLHIFFHPKIADRFRSFRVGAHKADLARYCLLYIYGGLWLDIKVELIRDIGECIKDANRTYATIAPENQVNQIILASPAGNPVLMYLIDHMMNHNAMQYLDYTKYFHTLALQLLEVPRLSTGDHEKGPYRFHFFQEWVTNIKDFCHDGLDRYGLCSYILDPTEPVLKTRRSSFPW